jgi:hypothetical protein
MIRLTLSDFAGDRLKAAAFKRQADYESRLAEYNRRIQTKQDRAKELKEASKIAFSEGKIFRWLINLLARLFHALSINPFKPRIAIAGNQENILYAGSRGEQAVADYFARALDDSWTMISGYKGYKGEIDQILVGPIGILAVEIKTTNGVIYINGDEWHRDKYDRYGNCVERGLPIKDNGGRSPSVQINQASDPLERFLRQRIPTLKKISRAVIFAHERSQIGGVSAQSVEIIATIGSITNEAFQSVFYPLEKPIDVDRVVSLIKQDHEYQEKRREGRRR